MSKRIFAGIVGGIAMLTSVLPLGYAYELWGEFRNAISPFHVVVVGEAFLALMAIAAIAIGVPFMEFARTGRSDQHISWVNPILLGVGCFVPGFLFSLPLTLFWARRTWPGDGQSSLAAMEWSAYVGVAASISCCVVLLRKRKIKSQSKDVPA